MNTVGLIDTHCHLDFAAFDKDRDEVLTRCRAAKVEHIIVPAVSAATWPRTIKTCSDHTNTHLALGLHPVFINEHQPQHLNDLDQAVTKHTPIAIGEIGLDYYLKELDQEKQRLFFTKQLIIAKQHGLPVIIHNRKAHDDCLKILAGTKVSGGIIHAFNGNIAQAEKYLELGFLLGFGGMLTYERSRKLRDLAKHLPLSAIVLETDAPDMTVAQHKGERNSPEYIPHIMKALAATKNIDDNEITSITTGNVHRMFALG